MMNFIVKVNEKRTFFVEVDAKNRAQAEEIIKDNLDGQPYGNHLESNIEIVANRIDEREVIGIEECKQ